ncbi:hypothetical protein [Deinococcus alpinitundrae]|uniref:hypothetical protein n=1 Tax=Deinococcus alpinitundrae TaxID=468913 RepID=UPI001379FAE0|nr:hypothetical protein [Deinococcus alpinitundrae]
MTNTNNTTADRRNLVAATALKSVNAIEPVGVKKFFASVNEAPSGRSQAQRALEGMLPGLVQYVLALKVASPELTRVGIKFDLDLPVQEANETDEQYGVRLAGFITATLAGDNATIKHVHKDGIVKKSSEWDRHQHGTSLVSAALTMTKVELVDGFKQPKSYRGLVGDDVIARSVNQLHKELREATRQVPPSRTRRKSGLLTPTSPPSTPHRTTTRRPLSTRRTPQLAFTLSSRPRPASKRSWLRPKHNFSPPIFTK